MTPLSGPTPMTDALEADLEFDDNLRCVLFHARNLERLLAEAVGALEGLTAAVGHMRVPQTMADAALQVTFTIGPQYPAYESATTAACTTLSRLKAAGYEGGSK